MTISSGMIIGQYRIDRKLGAGGMGEVYAATHLVLGREVALKTLPKNQIRTDSAVARFVREARATAALDHPNIVAIYDVAEHEGTFYIAMERVDGTSLRDVLTQRTLSHEGSGSIRGTDRRWSRGGSCRRYRSPRREAGQHYDHAQKRGQGGRFWPGPGFGQKPVRTQVPIRRPWK